MSLDLNAWDIDRSWTLFLDRDGVINRKLPDDYVKQPGEFEFLPGVLDALATLNHKFGIIVIVTNQQGIGKGLMSFDQLAGIHKMMLAKISETGGRIDQIYFAWQLAEWNHADRKPNIGMAETARKDFKNEIDFSKSIIVGDSLSDMEFGTNAGMKRVFITRGEEGREEGWESFSDAVFSDLPAFTSALD